MTNEDNLTIEMVSKIENKPSVREVLTNATFMVLFAAQFIENIGRSISGLALEFLVFELTASPFLMGVLAIIWLLPFVVIAPLAGALADRFDQRKLMLISNIVSAIASVGFVIVYLFINQLTTSQYIIVQPALNFPIATLQPVPNYLHFLWPLFLLCFINSASAAFFFPSRNAYTRLIVKKKNLLIANSVGSSVFQVATIFGFVLAGLLAARSYLLSFIVDATTFAVSGILIGVIFFIGKKPPEVVREKSKNIRQEMKRFGEDIAVGYRTIRKYPKISYMLLVFSFITFSFGAINVLFIVILQGEMGLGQTWYGILQALMGASGIITALILMKIGRINRKILVLNITFASVTVSMYIFAVVRNLYVMAIIMFSYGIMSVCINVPSSTLIQESVPYELQGRVFGTQQLLQGVAQLLGMGIVALIAEYVLPMWVLLASSGILTITIIIGFIYSGNKGLMGSDYPEPTGVEEIVKEKAKPALVSGISRNPPVEQD
ncbi:MAG: MFS transporter [Candidatus Heimdallarchaeota archaeon]|nr:MFS transporter [Candidatus Heimdallarchaeota archaeon]MCK4877102.1 MFS transporter [Candidatus Heimdallarchaeota archaeon]